MFLSTASQLWPLVEHTMFAMETEVPTKLKSDLKNHRPRNCLTDLSEPVLEKAPPSECLHPPPTDQTGKGKEMKLSKSHLAKVHFRQREGPLAIQKLHTATLPEGVCMDSQSSI